MTHPDVSDRDPAVRIAKWLQAHKRSLIIAGVAVAALVGGAWYWVTAKQRLEAFASRALGEARAAAGAGNFALAASDLSRLMDSYSGTVAAGEATILLAQIRLLENQPGQAVTELREFLATRPREQFQAPAQGLLGSALEQSGQPAEAGQAYEAAARAAWYDVLKAQYLLDAARSYTQAADTGRAISLYRRVLDEFGETGSQIEARVRLAELQRGVAAASD